MKLLSRFVLHGLLLCLFLIDLFIAYLHCRIRTRIQTRIPTPYFCVGQEIESKSVPKSVSGNVNEPFYLHLGIVIGVLLVAIIVGVVAYVALKGVPEPLTNLFSNTKEAVDANQQFQHTNLDTFSGPGTTGDL